MSDITALNGPSRVSRLLSWVVRPSVDEPMHRSAPPADADSRRRSPLGAVAGAYITWFVGSIFGGAVGLLAGLGVGGLEGAYAGVTVGVAAVSAVCLFAGRLQARLLGGLFVGAGAAAAGLALGLMAGVAGGALAGTIPALLGAGQLDFGGSPKMSGALRWAIWVAVGAVAGAAGVVVLDGFRSAG